MAKPARADVRGGTFIEILVASLVVSLVILGGLAFPIALTSNRTRAEHRWQAIDTAASQIEDLKQWAVNHFDDTTGALTAGPHLSATSGMTVPAGFTVSYTVTDAIDWPEDDPTPPVTDITIDYKAITVTCTYDTVNPASVSLQAYITKSV